MNVGGCKQNSGGWSPDRASQCRFQNDCRIATITSKIASICAGNVLLMSVFLKAGKQKPIIKLLDIVANQK